MTETLNYRLRILQSRKTILIFFLFAKALGGLIDGLTYNTTEAWGMGILALLVYSVVALLAYQRQMISTWAISIIMLYEASGPFINTLKSLIAPPMDNTLLSVLTLIVSAYILYGALVIFQSRHQCE